MRQPSGSHTAVDHTANATQTSTVSVANALPADRAPGPHGIERLRTHVRLQRNAMQGLHRAVMDYGPFCRLVLGPYTFWVCHEPESMKHVLIDNAKNYTKSRNYDGLRLVLGQGLVTSESELWKKQRRLVAPAFTPQRVPTYVPTFVKAAEDAVEVWSKELARKPSTDVEVHHAMMALTFRIVGLTLFSQEFGTDTKRIGDAFEAAIRFADKFAMSIVRVPTTWPLPRNFRFKTAMGTLDGLVDSIIRSRKKSYLETGIAGDDVMGTLLSSKDEGGAPMDDRQLRDEVLTLIGAGHETTANTLAFTLYLLSLHPQIARRVQEEISSVLGDRSPTLQDLAKLEYLERVIEESMRLIPAVWGLEREAQSDDVLGGYRVKKGDAVAISTWTLHRMPQYWENPEGFDPDRFLPEAKKARPRFAYLPFGGGPRVCIGASFAMLEAKSILAVLLRKLRFSVRSGFTLELETAVTLRPKHGIPMTVSRV